MCLEFFQKIFERKENMSQQENQRNHNDEHIDKIDMTKSFLEQNFKKEICEDPKFVPFQCIKIDKMSELHFLFNEMFKYEQDNIDLYKKKHTIFYRGQSNSDWFLESTLEREIKKYDIKTCSPDIEMKVFHYFKNNLRGKLVDQSLLNNLSYEEGRREIWAIGRHYDLKTPYLDWSSSIYVALFMACAEPKKESEIADYSALYVVNGAFFPEYQHYVERFWFTPKTDYYGRITAQKGFLSHYSIRNAIKANLDNDCHCAFKIYINNKLRKEILSYLEHIGISYSTMYPDLGGAVKFANNQLAEWLIDFVKNRKEESNQ